MVLDGVLDLEGWKIVFQVKRPRGTLEPLSVKDLKEPNEMVTGPAYWTWMPALGVRP